MNTIGTITPNIEYGDDVRLDHVVCREVVDSRVGGADKADVTEEQHMDDSLRSRVSAGMYMYTALVRHTCNLCSHEV